jgi:thiol:disulfide interchange protein DsbC
MLNLLRVVAAVSVVLMGVSGGALAQQSDEMAWAQGLRDKLATTLTAATSSSVEIVAIARTPFAGLIEIELNTGETLFSDEKGDYLVTGDLFKAQEDGLVNLTAAAKQGKVANWIAAVPEQEMIIFEPDQTKATITVFTDVDCTYCRRLHGEIDAVLALGIRVRYVAYPRGGEASTALPKMISVWCSDDRKRSLTQAKHGQDLPTKTCDNHVLEHYNLGNKIGISGTPAIVLANGRVIPGYLDPTNLSGAVFGQ